MKTSGFVRLMGFALLLTCTVWSCEKKDTPIPSGGNTSTGNGSTGGTGTNTPTPTTGTATFFVKEDLGLGSITVTVDGKVEGTITHYNSNGVDCGKGDVNVTKPAGTYSFKATGSTQTWTGTITIKNGICQAQELVKGSTSGTTTLGQVTFWTAQATGWSSIDVSVGGVYAGTIKGYYTSVPSCGALNGVTITKIPGTYAFTAQSDKGEKWSGDIIISANGCATRQLTFSPTTTPGGTSGACDWNTYTNDTSLKVESKFADCDGVTMKITNKTNITLECKFCIELTAGGWSCGASAIKAGSYATYWSCKNTGKTKVWAMAEDAYLKNNCPYPKP